MFRAFSFILGPTLVFVAVTANADVLRMEKLNRTIVMEEPISMMQTPSRGLSKANVRAAYGEPSTTTAAVGDPPISRWDYDGFHVFFEYDLVLHSVIPNKPLQVDHQDELQPANISELQ
ncbi:MAG: hypothetical protein ACPHER_02915 [Nevskiales bacterium]